MYSITDLLKKIKGVGDRLHPRSLPSIPDDLFLGLIIILVAFASFGLGRLSKIEGAKTPVRIENAPPVTDETFTSKNIKNEDNAKVPESSDTLVGSKSGTKYHYPWCPGASKIAEGNRIYFTSKADAEAQGYTPASNCKGL